MRVLSWILFVLAALVAGLGVFGQIWSIGMACSYVTSGRCRWPPPWTLGREDLLVFYVVPFGLALILVLAGVAARRRSRRRA